MPPFDPSENVGLLLQSIARLMRRDFERRAQTIGLTQAQWRVLCVLSVKEGTNQATLADLLEIQPITLTRLIDRLETAGWVARHHDPADRRAVRLFVTEKAQPIIKQIWDMAADTGEIALAQLSPTARKRFLATLRQVRSNLMTADGLCVQEKSESKGRRVHVAA